MYTSIDRIGDTVLRGLNIGVLAGVSKGILGMSTRLFGKTTGHRKKRKRR